MTTPGTFGLTKSSPVLRTRVVVMPAGVMSIFHASGMRRAGARSLSLACDDVKSMNGREDGHA
jgi:hypothetical protein